MHLESCRVSRLLGGRIMDDDYYDHDVSGLLEEA